MENLKLSVIVPIYNSEKYLKRCLDSILAQTRTPDEIICVNDGSNDGSRQILEEYNSKHNLIIVDKENGGLVSARKAGLRVATSECISYVDADDFIEEKMYEDLMYYAIKYNSDMVTSGFIRDYGTYTMVEKESIKKGFYEGEQFDKNVLSNLIDTEDFYRYNISPSMCNKIFKRDILTPIQNKVDDRIYMGEDDSVFYPYMLSSKNVYVSGQEYYHYCIRPDSMSGTDRDEQDVQRVNIMLEYIKNVFEENSQRLPMLEKQYNLFYTNFMLLRDMGAILKYNDNILYPFGTIEKDEKILLYGAGHFGKELIGWLNEQEFNIVGVVDKNASKEDNTILSPDEISNIDFDKILIATINTNVAKSIYDDLKKMGMDEEKLVKIDVNMI